MGGNILADTFDLGQVLAGRGYPTDTVTVYLDEATAYLIQAQREILNDPELKGKDREEAESTLAALVEDAKSSAYTFHLKGRSRLVLRDIAKDAWSKFPDKVNSPLRMVEADERKEYQESLEWEAFIEKIVNADGAESDISLDTVVAFRNAAPQASLNAIQRKIDSLREAGLGFEYISQSADFS